MCAGDEQDDAVFESAVESQDKEQETSAPLGIQRQWWEIGFAKCISIAAATILLSFVPTSAKAVDVPSFDCRKASALTEKLICSDPDSDLQWLDGVMAEAYRLGLRQFPTEAAETLRQNQREWLVRRDKECGISADTHSKSEKESEQIRLCLIDHYQKRNRALRSLTFHGQAPSADDVLGILASARAAERPEVCPVSREFDLSHYEIMERGIPVCGFSVASKIRMEIGG